MAMKGRASRHRKSILAITVSAIAALTLAACSSSGQGGTSDATGGANNPTAPAGQQHGDAQRGGNLVVLHNETVAPDLKKLTNVLLGAAYPITQVMQPLTWVDDKGVAQPLLAESLEQAADGSTWTITLRDGAQFSTGAPVTSKDVAFTLRDAQRDVDLYAYLFESIGEIETPDDKTVIVHMKHPDGFLPEALSVYSAGVIPENWGGKSEEEFYNHPIGAGPFMLTDQSTDWVRGQHIKLVRNQHYWNNDRPYLDSVTFKTVSDENQRILQLKGGQANVSTFPQPSAATVALEKSGSVNFEYLPAYLMTYLMLNQKHAPLTDPHLRLAIAQSVDRQSIVDAVMFGKGSPDTSYLPTRMPMYSDVASTKFNLERAKQELAKSRNPNGLSLTLTVSAGAGTELSIAQILQKDLGKIGIKVKINQLDVSTKIELEQSGKGQMFIQGYGGVTGTPYELTGFLTIPKVSGCFFMFCTDQSLARLGTEAATAVGESAQKAAYATVQKAAAEQAVIIPVANPATPIATTKNVHDFQFGLGYGMFLGDTWMSK